MDIAVTVRERRKAAGLTQAGLAKLAGASPLTVHRIETGAISAYGPAAQRVLEAVGLRIETSTRVVPTTPSAEPRRGRAA